MPSDPPSEQPLDSDEPRDLTNFKSDSAIPASINNFVGTPQEIWELVSFAKGASCRDGADMIDQTLPLKHWMVHEVQVRKSDTVTAKAIRTVLMDATGAAYGFVSNGVYDSLRDMVQSLGPGPYDPAINITVRQRERAGGRRVYTIEPAPRRTEERKVG